MVCERVLEEEGVKGDITIGNYAMDWIPYEDDLISMELESSTWKEIYLDGDQTSIYYAARSLMRLQSIYGLFPRIMGKGDAAKVRNHYLCFLLYLLVFLATCRHAITYEKGTGNDG
jgi:hypothetical protein